MNEKNVRAYCLKYAVTSGVTIESVELCGDGMVKWRNSYLHGSEWAISKNVAWQIIQEAFDRKRKSLEKQLAKLQEKKTAALLAIYEDL